MPTVTVSINQADRDDVEAMLRDLPGAYHKALRSSLNDAMKQGKTRVGRDLRKTINLGKSAIDKMITTTQSDHDSDPWAMLKIGYEKVPLIEFKGRMLKKGGVSVQPMKGKPAIVLRHAFIATMKSGHMGVFLRQKLPIMSLQTTVQDLVAAGFEEWDARETLQGVKTFGWFIGRGIRHQKRAAIGGEHPRVTKEGFAQRLPIEEQTGVSVLGAFEQTPQLAVDLEAFVVNKATERLYSKAEAMLQGKGKYK